MFNIPGFPSGCAKLAQRMCGLLKPDGLINFPTASQFVETLAAYFRVAGVGHGDHQLARRCPVYCLAPL